MNAQSIACEKLKYVSTFNDIIFQEKVGLNKFKMTVKS
jgi:hypothetical protein